MLSSRPRTPTSSRRWIGLTEDLAHEMITYTAREFIAIAEREYAFSISEVKKAARELGFGDDWKAAMEKVKNTEWERDGEVVDAQHWIRRLVHCAHGRTARSIAAPRTPGVGHRRSSWHRVMPV